ncbi:uncharacterized protein F4807DRAFT_443504 [Annulohypoxylon truncatum]|uniref:uncharacterized protein n=1 Tax=Annulohypoxylon truncatum TaxID=327061 RepID=UPI002007225C|nr:uncharacterized protein F4807DRAFT_443504 [Annulohypoxylon truncatum]KAI1205299.1 hypothetical protein F4807DRAFT_443504 [Annulohypoxylon truncatum]
MELSDHHRHPIKQESPIITQFKQPTSHQSNPSNTISPTKMKTFAALSLLFLGASAVPVTERQTPAPTEFDISSFSANTLPHGTGAFISFTITAPGTTLNTTCAYSDQSSASELPSVSLRPCDDAAVEWEFMQDPAQPGTQGSYRIVVTYAYDAPKRVAGYHEWPATDFPLENFGSTVETFYTGTPDFVITNLTG